MKNKLILGLTIFILIFIAGVSKGISDTLQFHYTQSIFNTEKLNQNYFNPAISWKNKYKSYDQGDTSAAFPGSTKPLVALTDAWHLAQAVEILGWSLALILSFYLGAVIDNKKFIFLFLSFILIYLAFHLGFITTYDWLLV